MHVSIVGAGALGRIYGARLDAIGEKVSFVVRPARAAETAPFIIERVNADRRRDVIASPDRVTSIPRNADVVLCTVRFDQLLGEGGAAEVLRDAPKVPIVLFTPMLSGGRAPLEAAIGRRVTPGMPSASGYLDDRGVIRYWLPRVASTLFEEPAADDAAARATLEELARRLDKAGIGAHLSRDVASLGNATTIAFFPLIAGVCAGEGVDGILADKELFPTMLEAAKETDALAARFGKAASWTHLLMRFVGPYTLKPGVALARTVAPEAVKFVDVHFGPKLRDQHLAMGSAILTLGEEQGLPMPALGRLLAALRTRGR